MVYYLVDADVERKKEKMKSLIELVSNLMVEFRKNTEYIENLEKTLEMQMMEVKKTKKEISEKKLEVDKINSIMKDSNSEKEKIELILKNTKSINVITVDEETNTQLSNGLVDVKRDVLMNILKVVFDIQKIRNIIGMTEIFYQWSKLRIFRFIRHGSFAIAPKIPPSGVTYYGSKITMKGGDTYVIYIDRDISSPDRVFLLNVLMSCCSVIGLALKSKFPSLHSSYLSSGKGMCMIFDGGFFVNNMLFVEHSFWECDDSASVSVRLELNQRRHTLHFFVEDKQVPYCVTGVPTDVVFAIGKDERSYEATVDLRSLRAVQTGTADPRVVCTKYPWG